MIIMIKVPFSIATLLFIFVSLSYHNYHDVSALYLTKVANSGPKSWLAIAKLKRLSLFISLLFMLKNTLDNVKIEILKVIVVSA